MDAIDALIDRYGPSTIVAALQPQTSQARSRRIEQVLQARLASVTVVVENLHDPHNGAAAIRSCEAAGLAAIDVIEGAEPFRFSKKVTIGCDKWVDVRRHPNVRACAAALRARGMRLQAAVIGATRSVHELPVDEPIAVVFGNERDGLTQEAIAACDDTFSIPMVGFTQSLNLSVSVAVTVHGLAARRRAAIGAAGDLAAGDLAVLRARWLALGVRGAAGIIERHVASLTRSPVARLTRSGETS